jgi:secreted trypsin-like serine protease
MSLVAPTLLCLWFSANPSISADGLAARQREGLPIVGGEQTEPGKWPAVVGVRTGMICTGTLVAPDLVLTAAHCFDPEPDQPVRVYFGDDLFTGEVVSSDDWGRAPDYCSPTDCGHDLHDFAWIRLPTPTNVEPIVPITNQAEFDESMHVGALLTLVGFGKDEDGVVGIKREVEVSLLEFTDSGREFRAGGDGYDTCSGDSGGPALVQLRSGQWRLAGVTSRGAECGQGGVYGVPVPELCWLRDSSGVDLLPAACEACDCVVLATAATGCDCELASSEHERVGWFTLGLGWMLGLRVVLRAGRS